MLIDVLTRVSADTGLDLTQQRTQLLRIANVAARDIFQELECSRIYREVTVVVQQNKIIALPTFVGELRGMRQHTTEQLVPLEPMMPRYTSDTLGYKWKNWRDLGESPVHTTPASIDTLTFETSLVENAVIAVTGQSNVAATISESLTLDAISKDTTNLFNPAGLKSITSVSARTVDITVKDGTGVEVAVLYNNERRTRYKIVDVSKLFWGRDTSDGGTLVDVLYKQPLQQFSLDSDSFPAGDVYDEAWYARCMSVYYSAMPARQQDANKFRMDSLILLRNVKDGVEYGEMKKLNFGRNKFMQRNMYNVQPDAYDYNVGIDMQ